MQSRPASPAVARFLARTAHEFTPRPPAPVAPAERARLAEASMGRMLLAMAVLLLLAFALGHAEHRAPSSTAPVVLTNC